MNGVRKTIFAILNFLLIVILSSCDSQAGLFKNTVPTGKEIKDPYLEQLFAPEFPFESIKVIETKEGKRHVIVKAKQNITDEAQRNYEMQTLRNRKIIIFRSGSIRTETLLIAEMRLYRTVSEKPYIVEYCEVRGEKLEPLPVSKAEDVIRSQGRYLIILINKDFGKVFKRVELYPEKDANCSEPPHLGKYPNSRSISCTEKNKMITFVYVSKDKAEDIYNYYKGRLKTHYEKVGFNYPERAWKFPSDFGMYIQYVEVATIGFLDYAKSEKPIKSPPPSNGVVFHIVINKIGLKPIIEDYSFIRVYYSIDQELIKKNVIEMKWLYPAEVK